MVYLVGAGPGDPGLMTRRSLELIAAADAILYDRLIPADAMRGARADADLVFVGKAPGDVAMSQEDINATLVELGRAGKRVVRLKGGDPFVFGRGGEEAEELAAAGVPFEVVPGVTAGVAAPAYAGIPVTHRDTAAAVAFVTGHERPGQGRERPGLGGAGRLPGNAGAVHGREEPAPDRRAADRRRAGPPTSRWPWCGAARCPTRRRPRRRWRGSRPRCEARGIKAPAITVIGDSAGLRETLAWLERRPLHGRTVAVTRARAQASTLADRLRGLGAEVVETPAIRIEPRPVPAELAQVGEYALVCVTSPNGASLLMDGLAEHGLDARALAGVTVAAIGPGTAGALAEHGIRADVVPPRSIAESLVEALEDTPVEGRRVMVARAAEARDVLPDALAGRGAQVDVVPLYDTVAEPLDDAAPRGAGRRPTT